METNINSTDNNTYKIVLNGCYGGFGLSYEAMYLYLMAKGKGAYFYVDVSSYNGYTKEQKYVLTHLDDLLTMDTSRYVYCSTKDQGKIIDHFPDDIFNFRDINRDDPDLIDVIEVMGSDAASGRFASLEIHELPIGIMYKIDSYDGLESLITMEDDDWIRAEYRVKPTMSLSKKNMAIVWDLIHPDKSAYFDPDLMFRSKDLVN
jgi:hypothetical protein